MQSLIGNEVIPFKFEVNNCAKLTSWLLFLIAVGAPILIILISSNDVVNLDTGTFSSSKIQILTPEQETIMSRNIGSIFLNNFNQLTTISSGNVIGGGVSGCATGMKYICNESTIIYDHNDFQIGIRIFGQTGADFNSYYYCSCNNNDVLFKQYMGVSEIDNFNWRIFTTMTETKYLVNNGPQIIGVNDFYLNSDLKLSFTKSLMLNGVSQTPSPNSDYFILKNQMRTLIESKASDLIGTLPVINLGKKTILDNFIIFISIFFTIMGFMSVILKLTINSVQFYGIKGEKLDDINMSNKI